MLYNCMLIRVLQTEHKHKIGNSFNANYEDWKYVYCISVK
jgi:hypothetical protein